MSTAPIPFDRLGIPREHRDKLSPAAPRKQRLMMAKAVLPLPPDVLINCAYVLLGDPERRIAKAAEKTLKGLDAGMVLSGIGRSTHPKVLEFLVESRLDEPEVMERIYQLPQSNDRTCRLVARAARGELLDLVLRNQQRLLMTPEVFLDLREHPEVDASMLERVEAFLRMQSSLPEIPEEEEVVDREVEEADPSVTEDAPRSSAPAAEPRVRRVKVAELTRRSADAEVAAALLDLPSPFTNPEVADRLGTLIEQIQDVEATKERFVFSFEDEVEDFGANMTNDEENLDHEEVKNLEQQIKEMNVGKKIKLAYLGNTEARKILLRDRNKQVAVAVVKSGRMSENEAAAAAGNKNLHMDVLREIASNKEWLRKYKIKVALVNNPKCPVSVAMTLVKGLHRSDLASLARNKNVPGVVTKAAQKMVKQLRSNTQKK